MTIIITKKLDSSWASPEDFRGMGDADVLEFLNEDIYAVVEDADIEIIREDDEKYQG